MKPRGDKYQTANTLKLLGSFAISESVLNMENYFSRMQISYSATVKDVFSQDKDGDTYLHIAVIHGDAKLCDYLISIAPCVDLLNLQNRQFQTPLHLAVVTRQLDIIRRLLAAGVSRASKDVQGNTPLHVASREGYADIIAILLCDDSSTDTSQSQVVGLKNYDGLTCLHLAAMSSSPNFTILDLLLQKGADINTGDMKSGRTVLHYAAELGNVTLTNYLLHEKQLDVNPVNYAGKTALSLAAGRGYLQIVTLLISHGADPSQLYAKDSESDESDMDM